MRRDRRSKSSSDSGLFPLPEESTEEVDITNNSLSTPSLSDPPSSSAAPYDMHHAAKIAAVTAHRNLLAQQLLAIQAERDELLASQETLKKEILGLKDELRSSPKSSSATMDLQTLNDEFNRLKTREVGIPSLMKTFDSMSRNTSQKSPKDTGVSKQLVDDLNLEILRLKNAEEKLNQKFRVVTNWHRSVRSALFSELKREKRELEEERDRVVAKAESLERTLDEYEERMKELADRAEKLQIDATEAEKRAMKLSHELLASKVVRERTVRSLTQEVADLQEELERTKALATGQADDLEKERSAVMKWKNVMTIALSKKLEEAKASLETLEVAKIQAEEEAAVLTVEKQELEKRVSMLQSELEMTGARMAVLVDRTTRVESTNATLKEQLSAAKAEAEAIAAASMTRVEALKNQVASLRVGKQEAAGVVVASAGFVDAVSKELDAVQRHVKHLEAEKHALVLKLQEIEKRNGTSSTPCYMYPFLPCLWSRPIES